MRMNLEKRKQIFLFKKMFVKMNMRKRINKI